jgi:hypothetical protein
MKLKTSQQIGKLLIVDPTHFCEKSQKSTDDAAE